MVKLSTNVHFAKTAAITQIWSISKNIFLQFMRERRNTHAHFAKNHLLGWLAKEVMKKLRRKQEFVLKVLQVQDWQIPERLRYVIISTIENNCYAKTYRVSQHKLGFLN